MQLHEMASIIGSQMMPLAQEKALTRTSRRAFRKAHLPAEFLHIMYVWGQFGDRLRLGNSVAGCKFTRKDHRRLRGIFPHVAKRLRITARACGYTGGIELDSWLAALVGVEEI